MLLSLAPLILLMLSAVSLLLGSDTAREDLVGAIAWLAGPHAAPPARRVVTMIADAHGRALATGLSALLLVHFSSAVFMQLRGILNRIWKAQTRGGLRGVLHEQLVSWVFVPATLLATVGVMIAAIALAAATPPIMARVPGAVWVLSLIHAFVPFALISLLLALIYRFGPGTRVAWRDVWLGAALTGAVLGVGNVLLGLLIGRSVLVSLYGTAGALVIIMLWTFYAAHLVLLGAHFTRAYAERHGSLAEPRERHITRRTRPRTRGAAA